MKTAKKFIHQVTLFLFWLCSALVLKALPRRTNESYRVILITADSQGLIGSRGDAAMLEGALDQIRSNGNDVEIYIACATNNATKIAKDLGCKPFDVWGGIFMPFYFLKSILAIKPTAGLIMGADIMDGHYSPVTSLRMIISADLIARYCGISRFLGFSLNTSIAPLVKIGFRQLSKQVQVNLRDPLSFERHRTIAGNTGNLVADTAFLLEPAEPGDIARAALDWINDQRKKGRIVLGVNFHPMLFAKDEARVSTQKLANAVIRAMQEAQNMASVSWLLVPHDDRMEAGDMSTLEMLEAQLPANVNTNSYRIISPPSAGELKTIAGALDGVITGRMHLAIASLGQGVPVLTFAYQGKFEGLMKHFAFPEWVVVPPNEVLDNEKLVDIFQQFITNLPELKTQLDSRLPAVLAATRSTFKGLQ
ncbi:polysaccharide pyruvyl transferase family protein [Rhodoferax sp.]|uniref:polysaccharide pyruvyl transferase family protein n=1 Tax=Rhodoferax sp. TaxID=50421 RepID=UPI002ACECE4D|nr:polysaccharide pyruvyl transferase family protein [Rhodoferax sp.]MDZ7919082.1 polysaccharide pyruvyl transferase family protein [Rhodoferax sp.]